MLGNNKIINDLDFSNTYKDIILGYKKMIV